MSGLHESCGQKMSVVREVQNSSLKVRRERGRMEGEDGYASAIPTPCKHAPSNACAHIPQDRCAAEESSMPQEGQERKDVESSQRPIHPGPSDCLATAYRCLFSLSQIEALLVMDCIIIIDKRVRPASA